MRIIYSIIFFTLLFISNIFLLKPGWWFYQDQSGLPKNSFEAYNLINTQFHIFSNAQYYLGFDQGILAFNSVLFYGYIYLVTLFSGSLGSQIVTSLFTYIASFITFYLFASLFFKDKKIQYILALLYTFSPLMYSFRGLGLMHSAAPLFIYSFYKYYTEEKMFGKYLFLNLITAFVWVSSVRFLQLNFFIVIPFLGYIFLVLNKSNIKWKKLFLFTIINFLMFLPVFYSIVIQFFQKNPGVFNYGEVFNNYVVRGNFYDMFSLFQSANIFIYESRIYTLIGLGVFISFLLLLLKYIGRKPNFFVTFNMILLLFGLTLFELGYVFGRQLYPLVIKFFPALTNAPHNALYVAFVPFLFLLGYIGTKNLKALIILGTVIIIFSTLPFLNTSNFIFQKYPIDKIPVSYKEYFIEPYNGIAEATQYYPSNCWRTEYMQQENTPTQCFNIGDHYKPVTFNNPRVVSGKELYLAQHIFGNPNINNFQITHNLASIIVAKDMVEEVDAGPLYGIDAIEQIASVRTELDKNKKLSIKSNDYFNHYEFKDGNMYDFFLYSPKQIVLKETIDTIFDDSLQPETIPVVLLPEYKEYDAVPLQQNVSVSYKMSAGDGTKYFLKLGNVNKKQPFALHLTQSFKPGWEIVWITKDAYEKTQCLAQPVSFIMTQNSHCQFVSPMLDLSTVHYITEASMTSKHHIEGNYVGNTWIIYPEDIPQNLRADQDLYAVIIYKNQSFYLLTIFISGITLLLLAIYTLMQEVKNLLVRKK